MINRLATAERTQRVLEHELHLFCQRLAVAHPVGQILPQKAHRTRFGRLQPDHGSRQCGLAAAGFTNDGAKSTARDGQIYPIHRTHHPVGAAAGE